MTDLRALLQGADVVAARAAAEIVEMQRRDIDVTRKEHLDVVTAADLASGEARHRGPAGPHAEAAILSEEAGERGPADGPRWIVDPLDGTVNYAAGLPWFSVTLAYQEGGRTRLGITRAPALPLLAHYLEGGPATH